MLRNKKILGGIALIACASIIGVSGFIHSSDSETKVLPADVNSTAVPNSVSVTDLQARQVKIVPAEFHDFVSVREAVGYIDFNQDKTVQVFSSYPGRVHKVFAKAGDEVKQGQPLFTVESPDLLQAESNLISTAGLFSLTGKVLERARKMLEVQSGAQKDVEQAVSDQQTAEANYRSARNAVLIFGKSESEMDAMIANHKVDGELLVVSPLSGRVTARNVAPGLLVQPGSTPAPFIVADLTTMWMVANVSEVELPQLQLGQTVEVAVMAYPGKKFKGEITNIGVAVDPNTHRIAVRSDIKDKEHQLHPQMLANYVIRTGKPVRSVAIPGNGIVREGDGTMTVFVTKDGHRFERRPVQLGQVQDGLNQVLEGLTAGEQVAGDGALFLSNMLALQSR